VTGGQGDYSPKQQSGGSIEPVEPSAASMDSQLIRTRRSRIRMTLGDSSVARAMANSFRHRSNSKVFGEDGLAAGVTDIWHLFEEMMDHPLF
jgi:hypothetical protein